MHFDQFTAAGLKLVCDGVDPTMFYQQATHLPGKHGKMRPVLCNRAVRGSSAADKPLGPG